jgi:glycosyltransferase involved in cell wall biosynthesis
VIVLGPATNAQGGVASVLKVVLEGWNDEEFRLRHIATYRDGRAAVKLTTAFKALCLYVAALLAGRIDLVHVHFSAGASFYRQSVFMLLSRIARIPVVAQAHAGGFPAFYEARGRLGKAYARAVLTGVSRLVVLSEEWIPFYRALCPDKAIEVVPNPVVLPPAPSERALGAGTWPQEILTLGRLGTGKGTYDLLAAVPLVLRDCPDARFRFGGDGEVDEAQVRIAGEPWADRVTFLGWVTGERKDQALRQAGVFILPSYAEGLPMSLLEAMAHGLPVIATPVGGIPRLVNDGVTGILVRPGDVPAIAAAIVSILRDPAKANLLGARARRSVAQEYDAASVNGRLAALYRELISTRTTARRTGSLPA